MFTGIVEEVGSVISLNKGANSAIITIRAKRVLEDVALGDSIAVNGVCLTVTNFTSTQFSADIMHETLRRSSLSTLVPGGIVNLERASMVGSRLGGHIVSGHIDDTGSITSIKEDDNAVWYTIKAQPKVLRLIVEKGSVALDGISLTVAEVSEVDFSVSVIPHTRAQTNLTTKRVGSLINIENDVVGKYVDRLLTFPGGDTESPYDSLAGASPSSGGSRSRSQQGITRDFLVQNGF